MRPNNADRRQHAANLSTQSATDRSRAQRLGSDPDELIDRIQKLRILLPAFAQETATARREAARLRSQNARLQRRLAELETRFGAGHEFGREDA